MKQYENTTRTFLTPRTNMIVRADGRAFHSYAAKCAKPFDNNLIYAMDQTALTLCGEIQGAKLGYVQSDEITVWATSYDSLGSQAWFGGNLQKIVSIAASVATATFNKIRDEQYPPSDGMGMGGTEWGLGARAHFDARVWTIPELSEVANMFKWRADDASRNSVQMVARSLYSHKELDSKPLNVLHDMIHAKGQNWNDLAPRYKRGRLVKRVDGRWAICDLTDFTWTYWMGIVQENKPVEV